MTVDGPEAHSASIGRTPSRFGGYAKVALAALALIVALIPPLHMVDVLLSTGADVPSSDDYVFVTRIIDPLLDGRYVIQNLPQDVFYNTHFLFFPALVYMAAAVLVRLDVDVLLAFGMGVAALRGILLYGALTAGLQRAGAKILLVPALSVLIFSASQFSLFEHGMTAVPIGLSQLGVVLGIWGLVRLRRTASSTAVACAGGLLASWSLASGMLAWPALLAAMIIMRRHNVWHFTSVIGCAAVAAIPYAYFLVMAPTAGSQSALMSLWNARVLLRLLGLPLAPATQLHAGVWFGLIGVSLAAGFVAILVRRRSDVPVRVAAAGVALVLHGLLVAWQVSAFRGDTAPWYGFVGSAFWAGVLALALAAHVAMQQSSSLRSPVSSVVVALPMLVIALAYPLSGWRYGERSAFLQTRAPASESCLRHWRAAPTHCERLLVVWALGKPHYIRSLAEPLEQHGLSPFAPKQRWRLQGDFVLSTVNVDAHADVPGVRWALPDSAEPAPWTDPRHLDLYLHTPNAVTWSVRLPSDARTARLTSAVSVAPSPARLPRGLRARVVLQQRARWTDGAPTTVLFEREVRDRHGTWSPMNVDITQWAGQEVSVRFEISRPGGESGAALFRHPVIDMTLGDGLDTASWPGDLHGRGGSERVELPFTSPSSVQAAGMQALGKDGSWAVGADPSLTVKRTLGACLADYDTLAVRIAASPDIDARVMQVFYRLEGQAGFGEDRSVLLPLWPDGDMHTYTYSLKLLGAPADRRLVSLRIDPVLNGRHGGASRVQLHGAWLEGTAPADSRSPCTRAAGA